MAKFSLYVTRKKYDELLKKYESLKMSAAEDRGFNELAIREMEQQMDRLRDSATTLIKHYDDLVGLQLSMVSDKLTDDNIECFYKLISPIDFDQRCLWDTCYELLGTNPGNVFHAEENLGWFEEMSYQNLVKWAEIANFHNIDWRMSGMYEFYNGSAFDESKEAEYSAYKFNLHYGTLQKIIREFPRIHENYRCDADRNGWSMAGSFYNTVSSICRSLSIAYAQMNFAENDNHLSENTDLYLEDGEDLEL